MQQLDFCEGCAHSTLILQEHEPPDMSSSDAERKAAALQRVAELADTIERVPHKDFGCDDADERARRGVPVLTRSTPDIAVCVIPGDLLDHFVAFDQDAERVLGSRSRGFGIMPDVFVDHIVASERDDRRVLGQSPVLK